MWWSTPAIQATQEAEAGRSWPKISWSKISRRFYLQNKLKAKELAAWLKW
jgi:hypothetical protein